MSQDQNVGVWKSWYHFFKVTVVPISPKCQLANAGYPFFTLKAFDDSLDKCSASLSDCKALPSEGVGGTPDPVEDFDKRTHITIRVDMVECMKLRAHKYPVGILRGGLVDEMVWVAATCDDDKCSP